MSKQPDIICIGSVLWDLIGRTDIPMKAGDDQPGRITRLAGGVALNIAQTLVRFAMRPAVLTVIGNDREGTQLIEACEALGIDTAFALRRDDLPTDRYMAIESTGGLVAAIADAHSLEAAGDTILQPLRDGRLGTLDAPYCGRVALDGNLTQDLLTQIASGPLFANADLRVAPASTGKAIRLKPLLKAPNATLYLNLEEAGILAGASFQTTADAARALVNGGCSRVLVTNGPHDTSDACAAEIHSAAPPPVEARRITGAGDTFMAAHIAAESEGHNREFALNAALQAAATYVSGVDA
ncbi:PfkB family carbohydrate kinase [Qingshengfaniella alkalisoli]|uniref:Kinase n=1 Tax=Qingshengfaniella alkalisoli TaxID=2599296 RepID=A0A5B8IVX0_9RHOB|nr:PfkB family carbohydrate kinase [Qingshengfaniella alkalisoli]QDY69021.1 kinase [Qingshengfaniella alkalisoli]